MPVDQLTRRWQAEMLHLQALIYLHMASANSDDFERSRKIAMKADLFAVELENDGSHALHAEVAAADAAQHDNAAKP